MARTKTPIGLPAELDESQDLGIIKNRVRKGPALHRAVGYISEAELRQLKIIAIDQDCSVSDIVVTALREWREKRGLEAR